jgi:hypothetical protein
MVSADNTAAGNKFCIAQQIYCGHFVAGATHHHSRLHRQQQKPPGVGPEVLVGSLRRRARSDAVDSRQA